MLNDKIDKKKKDSSELESTNQTLDASHACNQINKFFISQVIFHLIDLHHNKVNAIFYNEIIFKRKNMIDARD